MRNSLSISFFPHLLLKPIREFRQFISLNSRIHNLILALGVVTLGVMAVDLQTELSQEKEELQQIIAVLSASRIQVDLPAVDLVIPSFQKVSFLLSDETFQSQDLITKRKCRAPPIIG